MAYLNADGLWVVTDGEEGITRKGGSYIDYGSTPGNLEVVLDYTDIATGSAIPGASTGARGLVIPKGVRIEEVEIFVETAFTSGGAATLNVGLVRMDRSTVYDADGLVAALALTSLDAAGEKVVLRVGSTGAGALIGTTLEHAGIVVVNWGTAAYTAGKVKIRIKWYRPTAIG